MNTNLPMETLDKLIDYMQDLYNELTSGGLPDKEGKCFEISSYISFLKNLKLAYGVCDKCGRYIAPDESFSIVNDQLVCQDCEKEV